MPIQKTDKLIAIILLLLSTLFAPLPAQALSAQPDASKPLVIYYARTGTSALVAHLIADMLSCEREEVRSQKNRFYLGAFTCVNDQLFDRDDVNVPSTRDLRAYNPLIIVTPIWIHKFASPMRTYLNQHSIKGKKVYVIATNQGNYNKEREEIELRGWLAELGATVAGFEGIMTKGKPWETLRSEAERFLQKTPLKKDMHR